MGMSLAPVHRVLLTLLFGTVFFWGFSTSSYAAQIKTARFDIQYKDISASQAQAFAERAESALDFVQNTLGRTIDRRIKIVINDGVRIPFAEYRDFRIKIPASRIRGDAPGPMRIRGRGPAIAHEITHLVAQSYGHSDRYLDEGLAVYVQERFGGRSYPNMGHDLHEETKRYGDWLGTFVPLRSLEANRNGHDRIRRIQAYLQEGSLVRYLIEAHGWTKFMSLYEGGTYRKIYGKSFKEVEADWLRFIATVEADPFDQSDLSE